MVGHDGESQQVDAEDYGQSLSRIFNQDFAMIVIRSSHGVVIQQVAATNRAIHDMYNHNFIRRKYFRSSHHSAPNET